MWKVEWKKNIVGSRDKNKIIKKQILGLKYLINFLKKINIEK